MHNWSAQIRLMCVCPAGWNLKTDDLSLEYTYKALKFVAFKAPSQQVPRVAASIEHDFEF